MKFKFKPYQKVVDYFQSLESRLGYDFILGGIKHFGYYPTGKADISEKKAQELMQDLIIKKLALVKNDSVLDAGCGQGLTAVYIAKKIGCRITGITVNKFEVEKAHKLSTKLNLKDKVDFKEMDYTETFFPDNHFDAVYTSESLVHAYDLEKTLKEFKRILKPKGRIVFFEYSMPEESEILKFDKKNKGFKKLYDWLINGSAMFSLKKLRNNKFPLILKKLGFINVKEDNITKKIIPTMNRLYNLSKIPYSIINILGLRKYFFNTEVAARFFSILLKNKKKDLFRYNITFGQKA